MILFLPFCRFKLSQCLKVTSKETYPLLYHCPIPGELPCPTKESNKILLEILWSARNHGIEEIIVPKKVKISFDDRLLDISKFLVPKSVPEDYCWEETDTSLVLSLSSLSELPRGAGCFSLLLTQSSVTLMWRTVARNLGTIVQQLP